MFRNKVVELLNPSWRQAFLALTPSSDNLTRSNHETEDILNLLKLVSKKGL